MAETAVADWSARTDDEDRDDRERGDPPPLTAEEFWARIEAPLR